MWGGDADCVHEWGEDIEITGGAGNSPDKPSGKEQVTKAGQSGALPQMKSSKATAGKFCIHCGAWYGELGLEPTPVMYIEHMVEVFREVWRVLHPTGTLWCNIGDCYAGSGMGAANYPESASDKQLSNHGSTTAKGRAGLVPDGLKPKDMVGIPWMLAFALRDDGWYLRSDIIWNKPNVMPGSAQDRPNTSHEYMFLLSKSKVYYYDLFAIRENYTKPLNRWGGAKSKLTDKSKGEQFAILDRPDRERRPDPDGRNKRTVWTGGDKVSEFLDYAVSQGVDVSALIDAFLDGQKDAKDVWTINTSPYKGAHFACVDQDTECLTVSGWKKYNELSVGELMASYNLMDSALEWMPLESLHKYDVVNQEMVRLKGRNINQLLTPNHRCLIERREGHKVMVRADELKPSQKILVASDWNEASTQFPKRLARIIGWYVTEGHAGADCVHIYQSVSANPEYCKEIEQLLKDEGADYKQYTRTRDYNGEPRVSTSWRIVGSLANILLAICPNRTLPKGFLNWNIETLEMLWDALMKGDGHFREDGRQTFVQKNKVLIDQVQALATRLGFATTLRKRSLGTWALYKTVSKKRWLRSETTNIISMDIYTGVVWCPQNRNTTFVARRNGSVFITGNTYPPDLVEPCIKAGTSERGCCPCCGSPWERIVEKVFVATSEGRSNITGQDFMQGWEGVPRGSNKVTTVGWQPTCDCWFECQETEVVDHWKENCWACDNLGVPDPVPCTVLDPFSGSGTTLQVARALGRDSVGLDIATEYIQLARRRLEIDKLAAWCDGKKETVKDSNVTELQMFEGLEEDHGHEAV